MQASWLISLRIIVINLFAYVRLSVDIVISHVRDACLNHIQCNVLWVNGFIFVRADQGNL